MRMHEFEVSPFISSQQVDVDQNYLNHEYGTGTTAESVLGELSTHNSNELLKGDKLRALDVATDAYLRGRTFFLQRGLLPQRFFSESEKWYLEQFGEEALRQTTAKEIQITWIQNTFIPIEVMNWITEYDPALACAMENDLRPIAENIVYLPNRSRLIGAADGAVTGSIALLPSVPVDINFAEDFKQSIDNLTESNIDELLWIRVIGTAFYSVLRAGNAEVINDIRAIKDQFTRRAELATEELGNNASPLPEALLADIFNLQTHLISNKFSIDHATGNSAGMLLGGLASALQYPETLDRAKAVFSILFLTWHARHIWEMSYKKDIAPHHGPFSEVDSDLKTESAEVARKQAMTGDYERYDTDLKDLRTKRSRVTIKINTNTQTADQFSTSILPILAAAVGLGNVASVPGLMLYIARLIGPISSAYFTSATTAQQQIMLKDLGERLKENLQKIAEHPYYRPLRDNENLSDSNHRPYSDNSLDLLRITIPYQGTEMKVLESEEPVKVKGGEICLVDGGNFQGKTTLLRMLTGGIRGVLENTDTGIFGKPLAEIGRSERRQTVLGIKAGEIDPQGLRTLIISLKKRYNHRLLNKYSLDELLEWDARKTVSLVGRDLAAEFANYGISIDENRLFSNTALSGSEGTLAKLILALGIEDDCIIAADELLSPMTPENRTQTLRMLDTLPDNIVLVISSNEASRELYFHDRLTARINLRDRKIRKRKQAINGVDTQSLPDDVQTAILSAVSEVELDEIEKSLSGQPYSNNGLALIEKKRFDISQTYR